MSQTLKDFPNSWNGDSQHFIGYCHAFWRPSPEGYYVIKSHTIAYQGKNCALFYNTTVGAIMYRFYSIGICRTAYISSLSSALVLWTCNPCISTCIMTQWSPFLIWCSAVTILKFLTCFEQRAPHISFCSQSYKINSLLWLPGCVTFANIWCTFIFLHQYYFL